jgi:hypothetical protein
MMLDLLPQMLELSTTENMRGIMRAEELAHLLHAKKVGKGKWIAKCVAHPDRHPSLSIAEGRKVPIVMKCMSHGCETKDILAALGLSWSAVMGDHNVTKEMRERLETESNLEKLSRQVALAEWLMVIDKRKRNYWQAAANRARHDHAKLFCATHETWPRNEEWFTKWKLNKFIAKYGWERLWEEWLKRPAGQEALKTYGTYGTRPGTRPGDAHTRPILQNKLCGPWPDSGGDGIRWIVGLFD